MNNNNTNANNFTENDENAGKPISNNSSLRFMKNSEKVEKNALLKRYRNAQVNFDIAVGKAARKPRNITLNNGVKRAAVFLKYALENIQKKIPSKMDNSMKTELSSIQTINLPDNLKGGKRKTRKVLRKRLTRRRRFTGRR